MSKTLKASIVIGGSISGSFRSALSSTKTGLKAIGEEIGNVERRQRLLGRNIDTFGRMGKNVDSMRQEYAGLTREADKLRAAQSRLASAQERIDANAARRQQLGGALGSAAATFGVVAAASLVPVRAAVQFENAMLGVAKQLDGARDSAGNLTPIYFSMARQVQQLGRELPLATNELADMVAAGLRMGVANDEIIGFTRNAAMMADAFELPAGQLADDMGKIAGLFHIPIPRIGELADAINYLDDNSQARGAEIIDVMRRIGGMAQALKMPAREAAALGSTFLHLGSSAEVAGTSTNAIIRILGAASAQSKRVRNDLSALGLDAETIQRKMAKDATGGILDVLDRLNALNDEQRLVAATRIFGAEYGDDIAKLATGASEYRRQLALVNGEQAKGSMSREFSARLKTTNAQWQITKNRLSEIAVVVGGALLPSINSLMQSVTPAIEGFAEWSRENPGLIRGIIGSTLALTGLRVVTTGVAYAWTAVKAPVLSVMGFIEWWRATNALAAMGKFGPTAMRVVGVMRTVGTAIAAIGGGPIALAVAALTVGALVVRKYWEPIKAFMGGVWEGFTNAARPAIDSVMSSLAPLKPAWDSVSSAIGKAWDWIVKLLEPAEYTGSELSKCATVGRIVGEVLSNSFTIGATVVSKVVDVVVWLGTKIGETAGAIKTFFQPAIDWLSAAFENSIGKIIGKIEQFQSVLGVAGSEYTRLKKMGGGGIGDATRIAFAAATNDSSSLHARKQSLSIIQPARGRSAPIAPIMAARGGGSTSIQQTNNFTITQQPGESTELLADRVAQRLKEKQAASHRGRLVDGAG